MNKKIIIIIVIAVVVLAGAGVGAYFLFFSNPEEPPEPVGSFVPGEYFITNVKDSNNYLKVNVVLEVNKANDDEEFKTFMTDNQHIIRNTIIFILRSKTVDDLKDMKVEDNLSTEITGAVNEALGIDNVKRIYFNDYVMQ